MRGLNELDQIGGEFVERHGTLANGKYAGAAHVVPFGDPRMTASRRALLLKCSSSRDRPFLTHFAFEYHVSESSVSDRHVTVFVVVVIDGLGLEQFRMQVLRSPSVLRCGVKYAHRNEGRRPFRLLANMHMGPRPLEVDQP